MQLAIPMDTNKEIAVITDRTPFYAESGGQKGDTGWFYNADRSTEFEVIDAQKLEKFVLHIGRLKKGALRTGLELNADVFTEKRLAIACNHTATHLLHYGLRNVIGQTVEQAGSLVEPERLRFDYSMSKAPGESELRAVEDLVNKLVRDNAPVTVRTMSLESAKKKGAMALFSEKYSEQVRVIDIGGFSKELCGGSHLKQTGQIGYFKIVSDSSIAAGTRRIEAVTGREALKRVQEQEKLLHSSAQLLDTTIPQVPHRIKQLQEKLAEAEQKLAQYHKDENKQIAATLLERSVLIPKDKGGVKIISEVLENKTMDDLLAITDYLKKSDEIIVALLAVAGENKANLVLVMSEKLCRDDFNAVKMIKEIAQIVEGSGGGRRDLAQAGGKRKDKLPDALNHFAAIVKNKI